MVVSGRIVAGHRQTDVDVGRHRDGRVHALLGPGLAVRRALRLEDVAGPRDPDPVRRHQAGGLAVGRRPGQGITPLERDTTARGHRDTRVLGGGVEGLANHGTRLRPDVGVGDAVDSHGHRAVAAELLVDKAELVGGAPDIGAAAADGEGIVALVDEAHRIAAEVQRQGVGAVGRPVLGGVEGPLGLGVEGRLDVVVLEAAWPACRRG